jgi:NAD(P)-dependent dehydrogenase (short-subunit alcohol dehydrogenase family)
MFDFNGRTALVAGGAGEIGEAAALRLAELGASVRIADLDAVRGEVVLNALRVFDPSAEFARVDMSDPGAVDDWVKSITAEATIDIAINSVGWTTSSSFLSEDVSYWRKVVEINLMSNVYLAHAVLPGMIRARYGRLVFVGSAVSSRVGSATRSLYSASKAGQIGFCHAIAREVAHEGITVNVVAPGATDTALMRLQGTANATRQLEQIPRGAFASPHDQASAIVFLAAAESAHITGQTLAVDGGSTMV